MTTLHRAIRACAGALALLALLASPAGAQAGKGLLDPNMAAAGDLQPLAVVPQQYPREPILVGIRTMEARD